MQDSYAESMGFQGTGYAAFDPLTGSCGFFISGGIAGGVSLPSPLAFQNVNPEYIEYPEITKDGDEKNVGEEVDAILLIVPAILLRFFQLPQSRYLL
jgi:hypothetical protein